MKKKEDQNGLALGLTFKDPLVIFVMWGELLCLRFATCLTLSTEFA